MLRTLLTIFLLLTAIAAQASEPIPDSTKSSALVPRLATEWPTGTDLQRYGHLDIVTADELTVRHSCLIREITSNIVRCYSEHHHPELTYQRENVIAIIDPPNHGNRDNFLISIGLTSLTLVASFFVPVAASVTLRILSGIFLDFGIFWNDSPRDHNDDVIVYQLPNAPLKIKLRHQRPAL